ncbi:class I SAM-dependent methyltransferase [Arcanobacterium pinnipediorum]|uniref:Demethylmenaquinone methyltransferase n=1 Tax=Arcanobacterium pinnipediorum TaxID=1503041 RepID=A0ABY5AI91_9ACTO|nr:class I SAM-dependent methyltransferase [Arcanobacterium pinnipediorum]USR79648.1 class I SAM-dependent methyltransferase [Arcanobacterium pinnipediorum]
MKRPLSHIAQTESENSQHRASLEKKPHDVSKMFDDVAQHYDLTNTVLTGGLVHVWRNVTRDAVGARAGLSVLDVACGTGASAAGYASDGADVIGCDFSPGMISRGLELHPGLDLRVADATALPFDDETFDVVTISYGLRNVVDTAAALRDMLRVTKRGGKIVIAEFSQPTNPILRAGYFEFMRLGMPLLSQIFSSDAPAYDYLRESIQAWHSQEELARLMQDSGWREVEYKNLTNGIVALHRATRP